MVRPGQNGRTTRVGDAEVGQHHLVDGQGVGTGVHVMDRGRAMATHDAEGPVGHRCPCLHDREIRWRHVEGHHGGRAIVDLAPGVHGVVDAPGGALQTAQAEVGEIGGGGAELGHNDPQVGLVPCLADGVLHEAPLIGERLQVLADVDHPVSGRNEAEVGGDFGHRTMGIVIAVDGWRLQDGDVGHAAPAEVAG